MIILKWPSIYTYLRADYANVGEGGSTGTFIANPDWFMCGKLQFHSISVDALSARWTITITLGSRETSFQFDQIFE